MIHFTLRCRPDSHGFDGWFRSNDDFDRQAAAGLVECPVCGSGDVEKALMRPAIAKGETERPPFEAAATDDGASGGNGEVRTGTAVVPSGGPTATPSPPTPQHPHANLPAPSAEMVRAFAALQQIARKVRAEADYVGKSFAEEARRIHYGESESRQIYGEASKREVEGLQEEGITALPLVPLPEDGQ